MFCVYFLLSLCKILCRLYAEDHLKITKQNGVPLNIVLRIKNYSTRTLELSSSRRAMTAPLIR